MSPSWELVWACVRLWAPRCHGFPWLELWRLSFGSTGCSCVPLSLNWMIDRGVGVTWISQMCFLSCWPAIMKILTQKFKLQKLGGFQAKWMQKQSWGWRLVCGWVSEEDQVTASTKKKLKQVGLFGESSVIFICFQWNIEKTQKLLGFHHWGVEVLQQCNHSPA